jgi:hypothetical protein
MAASEANAVIAAVGTIIGSILTIFTKDYIENRNFVFLSSARRKSLRGNWDGNLVQERGTSKERTLRVDLELKTGWWQLEGTGKVYMEGTNVIMVKLKGAFRNDMFLKMSYENFKTEVVQFGSFVFELNRNSNKLSGMFIGYGHLTESVVFGDAVFHKEITD